MSPAKNHERHYWKQSKWAQQFAVLKIHLHFYVLDQVAHEDCRYWYFVLIPCRYNHKWSHRAQSFL